MKSKSEVIKVDFILGCNYWASNAGADMWRDFDADIIKKDIKTLSENGVKHIRVFPNFRDFQPVEPLLSGGGSLARYTIKGKVMTDNPYYLDSEMLDRFSLFLDICEKYNIGVMVGLITGWMSGSLFIPTALYGKNIITSPVAQYFEQLFIKGFIERFKGRKSILAWDLGNECNCAGAVNDRFEVANWVATISNAIRAADPTRQIISGMHELSVAGGNWTISDQALFLDMMTTHPYPFWCQHTHIDETLSLRTTLHPTAQTRLYSDISKKPCLAEEIGTMGPMICGDERSASFLRINMFSLWANGASGVMWWCAHDQTDLETFPYSDQMVERELGMLDNDHNPKPVLKEMKAFSEWLDELDFDLPPAQTDAVCVLTRDQEHWGVGYMTYMLAKTAGLNLSFAYGDDELPESQLYLMPSINGIQMMHKARYNELKNRVYEGADLYISVNNAILSDFESLSGLKVLDSYEFPEKIVSSVSGKTFECMRTRNIISEPTSASVLAYDEKNRPFITVNKYGKGRVFFVNAPIESDLIEKRNAFASETSVIYKTLFEKQIKSYPVKVDNSDLILTYHPSEDGGVVVVLNHHCEEKEFTLKLDDGYSVEKIYYGNIKRIAPYDALVFKVKK